jgi:hypothetical protein
MLSRKRELHPQILAVFQRLVLVPGSRHTMEAQLTEERQQEFSNQSVLRCVIEIGNQLFAPFELRRREWTVRAGRSRRNGASPEVAQIAFLIGRVECLESLAD